MPQRHTFTVIFVVIILSFFYGIVSPGVRAQEVQKGMFSRRILTLFGTLTDPSPTPTQAPIPTPTVPQILPTPAKNSYKIAVYGDSMVDTMGEVLEYLEHSLKRRYPTTQFTLYNYGQGSQNVEDGIQRLLNEFNYNDRHYPSLLTLHPDILIVGSFAYNPFSPYDSLKHKKLLSQLVTQSYTLADQVYMLAEISPLRANFGKGPNGVNWTGNTPYIHSGQIIEQLKNVKEVSQELHVPIINAFSLTNDGRPKDGLTVYINPSDGIHPSVAGHEFTADLIVSTIHLN